mmetsp:Transcript_203/g.274  ORF Transcript_203/g.274 Transcript_203/m.274 type:complete len:253 (+) Transcript_203:129-887(+)|eukprot:CAMPEP_0194224970 /NCGR_PEP_ID=MMETSP0156-20130528/38546_1 /TAXON_ID=33649 /ORGANISM="Thalassionema nitzschioides, Strain L26-B" /LENGTH=252 /DNA_ID=CAMNT_0038956737 /DNA_START=17 /DNA_END=775 /DNA_ORIENTATION=-
MSEALARQKEEDKMDGTTPPQWEACATLLNKSKTIHFVRHAQATHNEAKEIVGRAAYLDPAFHDARLTEFGKEQCLRLKEEQAKVAGPDIQLVLVSPCTRATETALLAFQEHISSDVPWLALECLREKTGHNPCDSRRSVSELKQDFEHRIDYSFMKDDEDVYGKMMGENRETAEMIKERAYEFFSFLQSRPETNILVVTHSAFLFVLMDQVVRCNSDVSRWFENCEMRTTQFALVEPVIVSPTPHDDQEGS